MDALLAPLKPLLQVALRRDGSANSGDSPAPKPRAGKGAPDASPRVPVVLLLDPQLCGLPWEALPELLPACSSVTRCFSAAMLQTLALLPVSGPAEVSPPASALAAADVGAGAASGASLLPCFDVSHMAYVADPHFELSDTSTSPGGGVPQSL